MEGIPVRLLGGRRFFERSEVSILVCLVALLNKLLYKIKELLAYLQLIDNPEYDSAFLRAVNAPARGIGEKESVSALRLSKKNDSCSSFKDAAAAV